MGNMAMTAHGPNGKCEKLSCAMKDHKVIKMPAVLSELLLCGTACLEIPAVVNTTVHCQGTYHPISLVSRELSVEREIVSFFCLFLHLLNASASKRQHLGALLPSVLLGGGQRER